MAPHIPEGGFALAVLDDYQNLSLSLSPALASLLSHQAINKSRSKVFTSQLSSPIEDLQPFHIILSMRERTPFRREMVHKLPNLRLMVTTGRRNAALDLEAFEDRGIPVLGCEGGGEPTVEMIWALIMAGMRNIAREDRTMRSSPAAWTTQGLMGRELRGATIGLVGYGRLGQATARLASVFGMNILVWSPNLTADKLSTLPSNTNTSLAPSLPSLLSSSDIVSLHLVLSSSTRHIFSTAEFKSMKKDALFVNTSRGGLVDTTALLQWLKEEEVTKEGGRAVLDVYESEPLGEEWAELRSLENVTLSPHMAYVTEENMKAFYDAQVKNVTTWLEGGPWEEEMITSRKSGYEKR
ncbi:hypothetical protein BT69DRAFT_1288111 [Atractiella rhizophila]|nr:hypothetical protein BT69DRAFT_1288111 [Atractiella rhizophila]